MKTSPYNLGRYARLTLILLMLMAQGVAIAHDVGDNHGLQSHPCATCIIGHGLGAAVNTSCDTPLLRAYQPQIPAQAMTAPLALRPGCHPARAPPLLSWNT